MSDMKDKLKIGTSNTAPTWAVVILVVVVLGLLADTIKSDNDDFYTDIIRLDNVATKIHQNYVEEISSEDLVDNAVKGMLSILDPHTSFFKPKDYEELQIHTEGKFGGLGIQISIRDNVLTVMTPISGTPASRAGIQSGDQIIKIDGKSTKGISIDDAVAKLRGEPGSDVSITIRRRSEVKPLDFVITREIITIKSVPYCGVLENNIGYVRLLTFSQDAAEEVEKAIKRLLRENIKGIILDLRQNPGGLLPQAIEVSEKFLEKKSLVVSTRGRVRAQNKDYLASANPVLPKDMPLVVLVNAASASASEIVAGAIQDWDRGVVMGDTTFGKGSVQSILQLDKENHLKLTMAFYYTPSGRCINKPENGIKGADASLTEDQGDDEEMYNEEGLPENVPERKDSAQVNEKKSRVDTTTYKTNNGRTVYGGGGIIPDTIVKIPIPDPVIRTMFIKDVFFKFANAEYPVLVKKKVNIDSTLIIDEKIMKDFYEFLDSTKFEYKSLSRMKYDEFLGWSGLVKDTASEAAHEEIDKPAWTDEELSQLKTVTKTIEDLLNNEGKREMALSEEQIRGYIRESLLVRGVGQDDPIIFRIKLSKDEQVQAAIKVLSNEKLYSSLLGPRKTK